MNQELLTIKIKIKKKGLETINQELLTIKKKKKKKAIYNIYQLQGLETDPYLPPRHKKEVLYMLA